MSNSHSHVSAREILDEPDPNPPPFWLERRCQVISHIARAFNNEAATINHSADIEQQWAGEQWSQGYPSPVTGLDLLEASISWVPRPFMNQRVT